MHALYAWTYHGLDNLESARAAPNIGEYTIRAAVSKCTRLSKVIKLALHTIRNFVVKKCMRQKLYRLSYCTLLGHFVSSWMRSHTVRSMSIENIRSGLLQVWRKFRKLLTIANISAVPQVSPAEVTVDAGGISNWTIKTCTVFYSKADWTNKAGNEKMCGQKNSPTVGKLPSVFAKIYEGQKISSVSRPSCCIKVISKLSIL